MAILEHSDIRRLLVEMKAKVEGTRALAIKLALHADLARALADSDGGAAAHHEGQVDLLTPVVKAYSSDQAFRVAEMAVQIYGGAGFVEDHPAEQYLRDAKIFSIYEGTNHIQALDLVSRKLGARGGENFAEFLKEIGDFVAEHSARPGLGAELGALGEAAATLQRGAEALMGFFMGGKLDQVTWWPARSSSRCPRWRWLRCCWRRRSWRKATCGARKTISRTRTSSSIAARCWPRSTSPATCCRRPRRA